MATATIIDQEPISSSINTEGIPVGKIDPSPFNPRQHFDAGELKKLGASLKADGQLQNCVVRPVGHRYELIAGERRWRAAKSVKLPELRCVVIEADDKRAVELAGMENYQREQLDAIEEARWFRAMLDQAGYTQSALAKRLGVTQGLVSQRLGLLDLPEFWQRQLITGVIPASWARDLIRWAKRPQVLKLLETDQYGRHDGPPETRDEFDEQLELAIEKASRPLSGGFSIERDDGTYHSGVVAFKASAGKNREILDIEEITIRHWRGSQKVKRAFNIEVWEKLQGEAEARRSAREAKQQESLDRAAKTTTGSPGKIKAAKKKASDQFAKRLYAWKIAWLQGLIVEKIPTLDDALLLRLLLHFTVQGNADRGVDQLYDSIKKTTTGKKVRTRRGHYYEPRDTLADLVKLEDVTIRPVAIELLQDWVSHEVGDGWRKHITGPDVEALAAALKIDTKRDWALTSDYLELHTKDQLFALAREWKLSFQASKRKDLIAGILKAKPTACPAELLNVKEPKR